MKKSGEGRAINPLRWAPALLGLSGAAALAVAVQARTPVAVTVPEVIPQPETVELMGPPKPEPPKIYGPPLPPELLARRSGTPPRTGNGQPGTGGLPGRIGPIGPIEGPLNAQVPEGAPIFGPSWDRMPLPRLPNSSQFVGPLPSTAPAAKPGVPAPAPAANGTGDAGSELPDLTKLAISRAANPTVETRSRTTEKAEATVERPVSVQLSLGDAGTRAVGDVVVVRLTANLDSYFVVMRVDASGKATTVFQSNRPAQRLACVVKAGPETGAEYLAAVASVRPLNSEDVTTALKGTGAGFTTMPVGAESGSQPGQAWSAILAHAGNVGGSPTPARWQRHEWDIATTSFVTTPKAEKPAETEVKAASLGKAPVGKKPAPKALAVKTPAARVPAPKPAAVGKPVEAEEGSTLPVGKPGETGTAPEKPAEPRQGENPDPGNTVPGAE